MGQGRPDFTVFILTLILIILGILMVFNSSTAAGLRLYGNSGSFLVKQAVSALAGIIIMLFLVFFPYRKMTAMIPVLVLGTILLLVLVLIPGIGKVVNSARRWIPFGPFRFQPSEFAKLAMVLYLGMILAKKRAQGTTRTFRGFIPPLLVVLFFFGLIFIEPDFSTAAILLFTGLLMFFVAGIPLSHLFGLVLSGLPFVLVMIFSREYMRNRLFAHLDPLADASRQGYQIVQSLIAFQRGGFLGRGIGKGGQKMGALPESYTDFILPAHAEEIGFFGVTLIMLLLLWLVYRVIRISLEAVDDFGRFTAFGVAVLIGWQTLINAGVVSGLLPATGLPLPFLSYGGSSLLMLCCAMGVVLNISRNSENSGGSAL